MVDAAHRCVFKALAMGEEKVVKSMDLSFFDWESTHSDFGTPLHAILFGKIRHEEEGEKGEAEDQNRDCDSFRDIVDADEEEVRARLDLLRFAVQNGANPHAVAPEQCDTERWWGEDGKMTTITFAGESAFECLLAVKRSLKASDSEKVAEDTEPLWTAQLEAVDVALGILANASRAERSVGVPEGVLDTWEGLLSDAESMDVAIRVEAPGREGGAEVRAHSAVLRNASEVLRAMLSTQAMREGVSKVIEVAGCGHEAVRLLVGLIYTGMTVGSEEEPSVSTMLSAVDLAHRWQLLHLVRPLSSAIGLRLDAENFEAAIEVALRLQLPALLTACRAFAVAHRCEMRARLGKRGKAGFQSRAVRLEVERLVGGGGAADAPRKRQRRSL